MSSELIVLNKPKSVTSEAIRTLRSNLQFTFVDKKKNVLMVTSSMPGEGKSFISSNLGVAFALTNTKVLLIDCDLRKGRNKSIFKLSTDKGLSDLLLDEVKEYKKYIEKTEVKNLSVLPKGTVPPNPSELLGSNKCMELINLLKSDYDLIILDCPPLNCVTDTLVLTPVIDEAVIVCSYKKTPIELLKSSKKALENANAKIAGVVMNNLDSKSNSYYSEYYK
ncbi:MAG: CpsD/CapB family tyrosine-protein kinase [bacterium]|nr:CpsD/CapB family tyrosine-protein kinase [bacterium]